MCFESTFNFEAAGDTGEILNWSFHHRHHLHHRQQQQQQPLHLVHASSARPPSSASVHHSLLGLL